MPESARNQTERIGIRPTRTTVTSSTDNRTARGGGQGRADGPRRAARVLPPAAGLVLHRLLAAIPVLLCASVLTFIVVNVLPGNAARQLAGAEATASQVARLEEELGLDRPAWERYGIWLTAALEGDFGLSLASRQPVASLIAERLSVTLELVAFAFVLSVSLAVPAALLAARWPNGLIDRILLMISMGGVSVAPYVLGLVLMLIFAVRFDVLPAFGYAPAAEGIGAHLRSLTLPSAALAFPLFAFYARFLRGDLLEQLNGQEFIVAARAKGLGPWRVLIDHALPNSLLGLLTLAGMNVGVLIGSTVIIEQIFGLPGTGQLLLLSIGARDVNVVQAVVLVLTVITVAANLIVDASYAALDPRIRHGR